MTDNRFSIPAIERRCALNDRDRGLGGQPTAAQDIAHLVTWLRAAYAALSATEQLVVHGVQALKDSRNGDRRFDAQCQQDADALAMHQSVAKKLREARA